MSVLNMSSSRVRPEAELERITQLAVTLSAQLTRVDFDGLDPVIAGVLTQVATTTRVEICRLVEFGESGSVARVHLPTGIANTAHWAASDPRC